MHIDVFLLSSPQAHRIDCAKVSMWLLDMCVALQNGGNDCFVVGQNATTPRLTQLL